MRQYNRAKQKRLDLISVKCHTISIDDEEGAPSSRTNQRRTLLFNREDDGKGRHHAGGGCPEDRSPALQHQQGDAREKYRERRFSAENGGEHRFGCGTDGPEEIGEAV